MAYRPERGWGFGSGSAYTTTSSTTTAGELEDLRQRLAELERLTLAQVESKLQAIQHKAPETAGPSVTLEKDVVLPTAHAEKDFSQQGKVVQVPSVDRDLTRRAKG